MRSFAAVAALLFAAPAAAQPRVVLGRALIGAGAAVAVSGLLHRSPAALAYCPLDGGPLVPSVVAVAVSGPGAPYLSGGERLTVWCARAENGAVVLDADPR